MIKNYCYSIFLLESPMKKRAFAFHAELRGNIQNIPHNHKVVFNFAHLNEGGAYDPKSGIFTCKEPGIYMFHWTILTRRGYRFQSDLMVNGVIHGRLALVAEAINDNRAGSSMVVVKLKPGNKVWVEPHSTEVGKYAVGGWSFFSGFKIWWLNLSKLSIPIKENSWCCCFFLLHVY